MTLRRLLLTSTCCAVFALGVATAQAQQQAAGLVQPKGGWAVTRIDESNTQGGAYCTLARQYQNGVIFSIGRNKAEEYSVAIDYQEAKLNTDKPYDVTLKAGNQTRQLQMMPVSPRAMVIRLGWDDSFFAAMEKSQSFSMVLDKTEKVELALPEYTKGKMDLAQCMETLKTAQPASGNTDVLNAEAGAGSAGFSAARTAQAPIIPDEAPPVITADNDGASRPEATRITQMEAPAVPRRAAEDRAAYVPPMRSSDVASLQEENEKLRAQLNEQRRTYEARLSESSGQGNRVAELEEKLRLAELRGGSATPVAAAAPVALPAPVPAPVIKEVVKEVEVVKPDPAQAQKITALETQVATLKQQLAAAPRAPQPGDMKIAATPMPNPEQARRITALQEEVESLKTQLAAAKNTVPTPLPEDTAKIAQLEKQLAEARQVKTPVVSAADPEIQALQKALAARNQEIADLQTQLKTREAVPVAAPALVAGKAEASQIAALQREVQQKEALIRAAQERSASHEREVSQLRQRVGQLQQSRSENTASNASIARLRSENEALRTQMSAQKAQHDRQLQAAAAPAPTRSVTKAAATTAPVATAKGGSGLQSLLSRAGISANQAQNTNGASETYQWRNGALAGRAEAYHGRGNALDVSQNYTNAQRNACAGDFAAVPGPAQSGRVALDLACVESNGTVRTQSTLFAEQGGQVVALILEAPAEDMDAAMDARDQLSGRL